MGRPHGKMSKTEFVRKKGRRSWQNLRLSKKKKELATICGTDELLGGGEGERKQWIGVQGLK